MVADISRNMNPTCRVVRAQPEFVGKQGHLYAPAISAETVGARKIHLQIVRIPPGGLAIAHKHEGHETALHIISGESGMWYGDHLERHLVARAGDFLYIPADMPHQPYNLSNVESCIALIARTDPNDQESVVLLPELDRRQRPCATARTWRADQFTPSLGDCDEPPDVNRDCRR